ncbi:MAG: cobalamin B12-binding domain-containing protein, partial [Acidobacteria bacterium]|nr:cobalamin B12-binding domain-containing protein [Acidobacteriota bacterium]
MKITLCYPSLVPGHRPKYGLQPLGVLYIAAVLKENGFDVEVIDAEIEGLTVEETVERILAGSPDMVGFSAMTPQLVTALQACARLKSLRPEMVVALGGAHFDSTQEDTYQMADCYDFIVYGEGEYPLLEVAEGLRKHGRQNLMRCLEPVGNVIFKDPQGKIVRNERRGSI